MFCCIRTEILHTENWQRMTMLTYKPILHRSDDVFYYSMNKVFEQRLSKNLCDAFTHLLMQSFQPLRSGCILIR